MNTGLPNNLQVNITNRQILAMALPIASSIFVPQINFITNTIFLSGLGQKELGLAGITGVYYLIFAVIGFGLNNGLQTLIARRAGEKKYNEISTLFTQGILMSLVFAAFSITITYTVAPYILSLAMKDQTNVEMAVSFLKIRIWGLPFLYIYQLRNALLIGINQSKYLLWGTLAETVFNIFFDYGFIYGKMGLPEIGFNGAAIASIIAEFAGMFIIFIVIKNKGIVKQLGLFKGFAFNKKVAFMIFTISLPLILQHSLSILSWEFFYLMIEHYGDLELAVSNTMRNIFGLFGCTTWAFGATASAMVSNIIGQGLRDKVPELILKIIKLSMGFALFFCLLINLFPETFFAIYRQDSAFVEQSIPVLRVITLGMIIMSFGVIWFNAVIGTGNTKITLRTEIIAVSLYCIYVFITLYHYKLPITYGWMSEWIYWLALFVPSYLYIKSGRWKGKLI